MDYSFKDKYPAAFGGMRQEHIRTLAVSRDIFDGLFSTDYQTRLAVTGIQYKENKLYHGCRDISESISMSDR